MGFDKLEWSGKYFGKGEFRLMPEPAYNHIALIPSPGTVPFEEVVQVAAALQTQVSKDVARHWPVAATIFAHQGDPPAGAWPIFIVGGEPTGNIGYHDFSTKQPKSYVYSAVKDWSLTASHECIEMLVDPSASTLRLGFELTQEGTDDLSAHVNYLVEACDPVGLGCYNLVGSSIKLSDFCTPEFYTDQKARSGAIYSFHGTVTVPRGVAPGGYLSWQRSDSTWRQFNRDTDGTSRIQTLPGKPGQLPLRTFVDRATFRLKHRPLPRGRGSTSSRK